MKTQIKTRKMHFLSKFFTIFTAVVVICLTLNLADLFSSLITVGGFTFTNNDIVLSKYNLYAVCTNSAETQVQATEHANICQIQGGAGYNYMYDSKYYTIASIYENESDANKVLQNLKKTIQTACIVQIYINPISLSSNLSSEERTNLENALNIFKNTYKELYDISVSLDTSVTNEVNAKLQINALGSKISTISTNFTTLFNTQMTNNFLTIKLKLAELSSNLNELISSSSSQPFSSQIKSTYAKAVFTYKSLAESLV